MNFVLPILLLGCLLLVGAFAASEAALAATNRVRLRHLLRAADDDAANATAQDQDLSREATDFIATVTLAANLPLVTASCLALRLGWQHFGPEKAGAVSAFLALLTITLFQVTPRLIVSAPATLDRLRWVRPARGLVAAVQPLVHLLLALGRACLAPTGLLLAPRTRQAADNAQEIRDLVESANASGSLADTQSLLESIFTFGDTRVHEVMIPRPDIVALPVGCTAATAVAAFEASGLSRLPLYEDSVDQVVGVLHVKDVLARVARADHDFSPRALLRPLLYLPATQKIDEALSTMRQQRTHLAIAIDEFGGTAGLLTVEDVLEELVGEIADEHDRTDEALLVVDERTALVDARLHTDDLEERWNLALPAGEFDTVGGVMIERLGRALRTGDRLDLPGATLHVHSLRGRRPHRIRIVRTASPAADTSEQHRTVGNAEAHLSASPRPAPP